MIVIYDYEEKSEHELYEKSLLLQSNESKQLPCKLEPNQVILIKANPEKEVVLLPKFVI